MTLSNDYPARIRGAWQGRISGCMLGKAVETFSMRAGHAQLTEYLSAAGALPLRDYIPFDAQHAPAHVFKPCCRGELHASIADDDINYSVLALNCSAADHWVTPWQRGVGVSLAGMDQLDLDNLVERTVMVAQQLQH